MLGLMVIIFIIEGPGALNRSVVRPHPQDTMLLFQQR